jgi:hypothetical protein
MTPFLRMKSVKWAKMSCGKWCSCLHLNPCLIKIKKTTKLWMWVKRLSRARHASRRGDRPS